MSVRQSVMRGFVLRGLALFMVAALAMTSARVAVAEERVDERGAQVDALFSAWQGNSPGAAVLIAQGDQVLHVGTYGQRNIDSGQPITRETRFYLASAAKQFTAACVLDLAVQGKLSLDDEVRKHVPEFPDYGTQVTLAQLLNHRSGIRDCFELLALAQREINASLSSEDVLQLICRQRALQFAPNSDFSYSNSNYLLLAEVVKRVSGQSLRDYAAERIFAPLGMTHTEFRDSEDQTIGDAAVGHSGTVGNFDVNKSMPNLPGSGGLYSTVDDLLLWERNLATAAWGGELTKLLQTPPELGKDQHQSPIMAEYSCGMLIREYRGAPVVIAPGGSFGFDVSLARFPQADSKADLTVIVLTNADALNALELGWQIADIYLKEQLSPQASPTAGPKQPPGMLIFRGPNNGDVLVLGTRPSGESFVSTLSYKFNVQAQAAGKFSGLDTALPVSGQIQTAGGTRRVTLTIGEETPLTFAEVPLNRPAADQVAALAGTYSSPELDAEIRFEASGPGLKIDDSKMGRRVAPFMPITADLFVSDTGVQLDVIRDSGGRVQELKISTPRARGIVLRRN